MANWNKPDLSSYEVNVLDELKNRDLSLARMFKGTTDTNLPVDSIRLDWTGLVGRFGKWNGTTWDTLTLSQDNLPSATSSVKGIAKIATTAEITARTSTDTVVTPSGLSSARVASADKLTSSRTIGGVSFDGSANISLPGVNTAGNQNTSGNAATATYATSAGSAESAGSANTATYATSAGVSNENRASISSSRSLNNASTAHDKQVNSSYLCSASGIQSQVNASVTCSVTSNQGQVNASRNATNSTSHSSAWGYSDSGTTPSTANQKIRLESITGIGRFKGNTTTGGFDYAEYFPNLTQGIIPDGTIVTLVDEKIRPAQAGDFILGTVSATAGVIGNAPEFCWSGRFLKDEFGRELKQEADLVRWQSEDDFYNGLVSECDKPIPSDATYYKQDIPIENPDYVDISDDYTPRGDRKDEWSIVGLMGQVYVRVYEDIEHNTYVSADGKQSDTETRLYCMKMTTPFSSEKGHGVAFCLLR